MRWEFCQPQHRLCERSPNNTTHHEGKEKAQTFPLPNVTMSACSYRMDIDFRISYMLPSSPRSVHGQSWFILIAVLCFCRLHYHGSVSSGVFRWSLPHPHPGTGCASPACVCDCVFCISGSRKKKRQFFSPVWIVFSVLESPALARAVLSRLSLAELQYVQCSGAWCVVVFGVVVVGIGL